MIRPRLRLCVCASAVAVTLGGSVLTQAAGPGAFISKLWKREPVPKKEVTPGFSPFGWLRRDKSESTVSHVQVSDGGRSVVSERPELVSDPFLAEQTPQGINSVATTNPKIIVRPEPRRSSTRTQAAQRDRLVSTGDFPQSTSNAASSRQMTAAPNRSSSRQTTAEQPVLPENITGPARAAENGQFVNNFDSEFQKLFNEVVDESRQTTTKTAAPRLPDEAVADFAPPADNALPEVATVQSPDQKQDIADFVQERSRSEVSDLIRESRSEIESSVLARRAVETSDSPAISSSTSSNITSSPRQIARDQSGVSSASHSRSSSSTTDHTDRTAPEFQPTMLPDHSPQTLNQMIVPSSMVPERQLFTSSDEWLDRDQLEHGTALGNATTPYLQPVVRVVPGERGAGVSIESGQCLPIKPRVSSNVAPTRSVPDTSQFRRLSFEGGEGSLESEAVQAIGEDVRQPNDQNGNAGQSGASAFMIPAVDPTSGFSSAFRQRSVSNSDMAMMIIPDSRTGECIDATKAAAAPAPPLDTQTTFEWPDETNVALQAESGSTYWWATMFGLALAGGTAGLFFRRKAQGRVFGITGTGPESEIS